jgi:hypothetical protein
MARTSKKHVLYHETFTRGPGPWRTGKIDERGSWHRNCFGEVGIPAPVAWDPKGGPRKKGCAFAQGPWYFDDNHGELFWLYLAFFMNRSADAPGLKGADLRGATIDLTLRGVDFDLKGTQLYFWIQGSEKLYNWCLYTQPIRRALEGSRWLDERVTLVNDERQWRQMGLLNGGLARRLRIVQSTSVADGSLDGILNGGHVNFGFILGGVDPVDPPRGRIAVASERVTAG